MNASMKIFQARLDARWQYLFPEVLLQFISQYSHQNFPNITVSRPCAIFVITLGDCSSSHCSLDQYKWLDLKYVITFKHEVLVVTNHGYNKAINTECWMI